MALDFQPAATGYSLVNALYLANACHAAYQPALDTAAASADLAFTAPVTEFRNGQGIRGFVGLRADGVILSFQGTADIPGWMTDANIVQIEDAVYDGRVHRGFARGLQSVWPQVLAAVSVARARPVWVTGHSLGGALATLAAVRLKRNESVTPAGTYTFGSPRVGNLDFYWAYGPVNYRHVNNEDVVPHVPIEEMLVADLELTLEPGHPLASLNRLKYCRYKHVGTLKYFDRQGMLGEGMSDWAMKKDAVMDALAKVGHPKVGAIDDHAITNYIKAVQASLAAGLG